MKRYNRIGNPVEMDSSDRDPFFFCRANAIRALAFDCDGVLLDSGRSYYLAYERVLREAGAQVSPREIYMEEGKPTAEVLRVVLERHEVPIDPGSIPGLVERRREYQSLIGGREFFPAALELLSKLRDFGYKLAMVTGSSRRSVELILTPDIRAMLDAVITADDVQRPKPEPEPFERAARAMGVAPANCLAIENAPYGVQSAKAAGCPVIAICTTLSSGDLQDADWFVPDHGELVNLLTCNPTKNVPHMTDLGMHDPAARRGQL